MAQLDKLLLIRGDHISGPGSYDRDQWNRCSMSMHYSRSRDVSSAVLLAERDDMKCHKYSAFAPLDCATGSRWPIDEVADVPWAAEQGKRDHGLLPNFWVAGCWSSLKSWGAVADPVSPVPPPMARLLPCEGHFLSLQGARMQDFAFKISKIFPGFPNFPSFSAPQELLIHAWEP